MAQGLVHRLAVEHCMKGLAHARAVLFRQQVEVVDVVGQRLMRIEAKQCLGAS